MQRLKRVSGKVSVWAIALICALGWAVPAVAQNVTTGALSGLVSDDQGGILPGADVVALHEPTGTTYVAVTQDDGRFNILNVRVGGPYTVTVKMSGFKEQIVKAVTVNLGEERPLEFKLQLASMTEEVTVTADANPIFSNARTGTAANVSEQAIDNMPTVSRTLEDFARLSPFFTPTATNDQTNSPVSVAGRNPRYNNLQIDGAVNNDLFGISESASPGGTAGTQPISLDAIQELQLVVSPYDVRQGGFSGGGINAVTKSGTNDIHGGGYYYTRNESLVGKGPDDREIAQFKDTQFGASVGGPIRRNRAFAFGNIDFGRRDTPTGFSADGSSGQNFRFSPEAARVRDILRNKYGYDPGDLSEFSRGTNNNKVFVRSDINISPRHQLTVRHNYVDADNQIGNLSLDRFIFPDFFYDFGSKANSTVGQLNSSFGSFFNELRVTYQRIRDNRQGRTRFPTVTVRVGGTGRIIAGRENFSTANRLDQDVIELTNDVTWVKGRHTLTFGTHNEFFKFENLFIRDNFGNYEFNSVDDLDRGIAQGFDYSFSVTGNPQQSARFGVNQLGFYAGDQWRVLPNFTLTFGARIDVPLFPDRPTRNPVSEAAFGFRTDEVPSGQILFSPRLGFNWNLGGERRQQIRGGVGIFSGRTPYVWLSNQYGNTGIEFTRLRVIFGATQAVPFNPNPDGQPTSVGSAATNEIDLIDPDYKFPTSLRWNLAYDRDLGFLGLVGTFEALFSETIKDIDYRNLNLVQNGTRPDGRPTFGRQVGTLSDVIFLTNTTEGRQWTVVGKVDRPFQNGLFVTGSYAFGSARSISDGTSSQAASNWGNVYSINPNDVELARSNFEVRHRINIGGSYTFRLPASLGLTTSLYYNGQSGRPYVVTFGNDANGDGRTTNDLFYVPSGPDDVIIRGGTWADLDAFISGDDSIRDFRGQIAPRNASTGPWTHGMDFRAALAVPTGRIKTEVLFDVLNFANLFDANNGLVQWTLFNQVTPIRFDGIDAATGRMIYNISNLTAVDASGQPTFRKFNRDDLRSRWQAQIGLRVSF